MFRIEQPTNFPIGTMNSYLFLEPEPVLIDCSVNTDEALSSLLSGLSSHGLTPRDLTKIIITHAHSDHMGLLGRLGELTEAEIWVTPIAWPWATNYQALWRQRSELVARTMRLGGVPEAGIERAVHFTRDVIPSFWSAADPTRLVDFPIDGTLEFGGHRWQVIYTPGHASSHTCFYQPEQKIILSADTLLPRVPLPLIEEWPHDPTVRMPGLPHLVQTLKLLQGYDFSIAYPGHGPPLNNPQVIIAEQLVRIEKRRERCLELVQLGRHTAFEVVQELYGHILQRDPYTAFCLTLGYLDLLEEAQLVKKRVVDGVWIYLNSPENP